MRRVGYYITITTDGMYADPDGGLYEFEPDETGHRYANRLVADAGDIVMGRTMYDLMSYWDELDVDDPATPEVEREFATFWRQTPKHVVTRGTPTLRPNSDTIDGDVIDFVRRLRAGEGPPIMLAGGADLFAQASEAGMIDDYRFAIAPMALGAGKGLFASLKEPLHLRLVASQVFPDGTLLVEYIRDDRASDDADRPSDDADRASDGADRAIDGVDGGDHGERSEPGPDPRPEPGFESRPEEASA